MTSSKRASAKDQEVQTLHGNYKERKVVITLYSNALRSNEREIFNSKIPVNKQIDQYTKNTGGYANRPKQNFFTW